MDRAAKVLLVGLIVLLFASGGFAATEKLTVSVNEQAVVAVTHNVSLAANEVFLAEFLCQDYGNLAVSPSGANYEIQEDGVYLNSAGEFSVSYSADCILLKDEDSWQINVNVNDNTEEIIVTLPASNTITGFYPVASVYFQGGKAFVEWTENNLAGYGSVSVNYKRNFSGSEDLLLPIIIIVLVIVVVLVWFFVFRKGKKIKLPSKGAFSDAQKNLIKGLASKDQEVMKCIVLNEGISQKVLQEKCKLSKATLSRTLYNLKEKGFVDIVQDGYTNKIHASEWFKGNK